MRNKFIEPASVRVPGSPTVPPLGGWNAAGTTYDWTVNHDAEEQTGVSRAITHGANTANVGLVRHQGEKAPLTLRYTGTILTREQLVAMYSWFALCETQTIHFEDCEQNVYEVIITSFNPIRKRVVRNSRDLANAELHVWTYSIEMDVIQVISGYLAAVV